MAYGLSGLDAKSPNHEPGLPGHQRAGVGGEVISPREIADNLKARLALCREILTVVEREAQALRRADNPSLFEFHQLRKNLLPRLNQSLDTLRRHRVDWQKFSPEE